MKRVIGCVLILGVLGSSGCAAVPKQRVHVPHTSRAILISIDGLRGDMVTTAWMPHLTHALAQGAYTFEAQCEQPSVTVPNHISMVTGRTPHQHGFLKNRYPSDIVLRRSIFDVAHAAGISTALYVSKHKLRILARPTVLDRLVVVDRHSTQTLIQQVLADLHNPTTRWGLSMIHIADPDAAGHADGWLSPTYRRAVQRADTYIGALLDALDTIGLREDTLMLITADHGGDGHNHTRATRATTTIPWILLGPGVPVDHRILHPVRPHHAAAVLLSAVGLTVPASMGTSVLPLIQSEAAVPPPVPASE